MTTLEMLGKVPSVRSIDVDGYNFESQTLFAIGTPEAWQTGNSVQTFNSNGQPYDAKSDDND